MPWEKIKEEPYNLGFRRIVKKYFKLPDGRVVDFDIKNEGPAVCILAVTADNKVILSKQFRPGPEKILMEMPGGYVDKDLEPEDSAKAELLEETGYEGKLYFVGKTLDCAYSNMVRYNFVALNCKKIQEPQNDKNEFIEVVTVTFDEFNKLLKSGQMTDIESGYSTLNFLKSKNLIK